MRPSEAISPMRRARCGTVVALAALAGLSASPAAADGVVIGDSLGVGVSMASGLTRLARNSVSIRGGGILGQIKQAPPGSTVFMSLGTNDAVGRVDGLDGDIGRIVAASSNVNLVWIGPPCVMKAWDANARTLDGIIRARTAGTGVTYVSMRDPGMCASGARAKDGVHFTMGGYRMMWAKARSASGFTGGSARTAVAAAETQPPKRKARRKAGTTLARAETAAGPQAAQPAPERSLWGAFIGSFTGR